MDSEHPSKRTFELLSNEVRLRIITALGDANGREGYATLAFSELQRSADVDDSGQLTYHLGKLCDEFLEETAEGYRLTLTGIRAYQAILAHRTGPNVDVDPVGVAGNCDACDGALEARYEGGRAYITCVSCGEHRIRYPVSSQRIDPDDPTSITDALQKTLLRDYTSMFNGVCPYCTGHVATEFAFDSDHWDEFDIATDDVPVSAACTDCSWFMYANLPAVLRIKEPVQAFFAERGRNIWEEPVWVDNFVWTSEAVSRDPIRIEGYFEAGGDRLQLVVDEDLNIAGQQTVEGE